VRWEAGRVPRLRPALALVVVVVAAALAPALPDLLRGGLPAVRDETGLSGQGLRRAAGGPPEVVRLEAAGERRGYLLARARRVERGAQPGLLLVLPAANRTVRETFEQLGLDALRDHGLAVAVAAPLGGWNAGSCCGRGPERGTDDVTALAVVADDAAARAGARRDRTAVLGYSTGGFMVYRLLCEGGLDVRAAVEVAGSLATDCAPTGRTPPLLAVHGTRDATVPLVPTAQVVPVLGAVPRGVRDAVAELRGAGGCGSRGCPVELVEVDGAGHRWEDLRPLSRIAGFLAEHVPGVR
jgi:poly(3-hydroxybutyrate) depolymerase